MARDRRDDDDDDRPRRRRRDEELDDEERTPPRRRRRDEEDDRPRDEDDDDRPRRRRRRDEDEDDAPRPRKKRRAGPGKVPTERVYVHDECDTETVVSEGHFTHITDPFRLCTATYCCGCERHVPLKTVRWADTGEVISEYRARLRQEAPLPVKLWRLGLGWVCGGLVGGALGLALHHLMQAGPDKMRNNIVAGVIVGAIAISMIGAYVIESSMGIDYRKER